MRGCSASPRRTKAEKEELARNLRSKRSTKGRSTYIVPRPFFFVKCRFRGGGGAHTIQHLIIEFFYLRDTQLHLLTVTFDLVDDPVVVLFPLL